MSIQDKLERILRELHIMVSRAPALEADGEIVLIQKKEAENGMTIAVAQREWKVSFDEK